VQVKGRVSEEGDQALDRLTVIRPWTLHQQAVQIDSPRRGRPARRVGTVTYRTDGNAQRDT
jgi:hypothetical protein